MQAVSIGGVVQTLMGMGGGVLGGLVGWAVGLVRVDGGGIVRWVLLHAKW